MADTTGKESRGEGPLSVHVVEMDGYITRLPLVFNQVVSQTLGNFEPVPEDSIGAVSDLIKLGGGSESDFKKVRRALQQFPLLWSSRLQLEYTGQKVDHDVWYSDTPIVFHCKRFKLNRAPDSTITQTVRWLKSVFHIDAPIVWYEEDAF